MAPKAASTKRRRKVTGRSEGLEGESGESGSARGSDGEGVGGRRQERVRKGEKSGHGRHSNGLWSKGDSVRGPGFDGKRRKSCIKLSCSVWERRSSAEAHRPGQRRQHQQVRTETRNKRR